MADSPIQREIRKWLDTLSTSWRPRPADLTNAAATAIDQLTIGGFVELRYRVTMRPDGAEPIVLTWKVSGDYGDELGVQVRAYLTNRGHEGCIPTSYLPTEHRLTAEGQRAQEEVREARASRFALLNLGLIESDHYYIEHSPICLRETSAKSKPPKMTAREANVKARDFLRGKPMAKAREVADEIGCALGMVPKLPAWKAVKEAREKLRPAAKTRTVGLSRAMEGILATTDDSELERLTAEEKAAEVDKLSAEQTADEQSERLGRPRAARPHRRTGSRS